MTPRFHLLTQMFAKITIKLLTESEDLFPRASLAFASCSASDT